MLDPGFKGSITAVASAGARVCAYLSLGEIRATDPFYSRVSPDILLGENPAWPGTFRIDLRRRSWRTLVLDHLIPAIYTRKFAGLLLDTLDTPHHLEYLDPERYGGMGQAAIDLIREIRISFPHKLIFANRGYAMLADVHDCLDGVVAEGLLTTSDPSLAGAYKWNRPSEVALQLSRLSPVMDGRRRLQVLSLDYWNPEDRATIKKIYADARELGCQPYVATRLLDRILPEPV